MQLVENQSFLRKIIDRKNGMWYAEYVGAAAGDSCLLRISGGFTMLYHAKNGTLPMDGTTMDYIRFGSGKRTLIMLPGLGDGLRTMKGTALPMAMLYHVYAKDFTVYAFSRKNQLPEGYSTRDMARDLCKAMDLLGIAQADLFGVSMGGMISQHFAADYPERVGKLILAVTCPRPNPTMVAAIREWMQLAQQGDHTALMDSNVKHIYTEGYYNRNKWMIPITGKLTKPQSYGRFLTQANACMTHNAYDRLPFIFAPTLVVGGGKDQVVGCEASREIAQQILGAKLRIYPEHGHGVYEEAKGFHEGLLAFLR